MSLENQLLEAKSAQLRHEKAAAVAAAATAKLEGQLAKLSARAWESSAELSALTAERRILKARLMQVCVLREGGQGSSWPTVSLSYCGLCAALLS